MPGRDGAGDNIMRVSIICVGNDFHGDDGFGPAVAAYLSERYMLPAGVEVISHLDFGRALVADLMACEAAVVVGASDDAAAPVGSLVAFGTDDPDRVAGMTSTLDMNFADVLNLTRALGIDCSRIRCFGAQIDRERGLTGTGMSERVEAAVAPCARAIALYLNEAYWLACVDYWAMTSDTRALVADPASYARAVLDARGMSDQLDAVVSELGVDPMPDYKIDEMIDRIFGERQAA